MNDQHQNNNNRPDGGRRPRRAIWIIILAAVVLTMVFNSIFSSLSDSLMKEISFTEFMQLLEDGKLHSVEIQPDRYIILTKEQAALQPG